MRKVMTFFGHLAWIYLGSLFLLGLITLGTVFQHDWSEPTCMNYTLILSYIILLIWAANEATIYQLKRED